METNQKELLREKGPELLHNMTVNNELIIVLKKHNVLSLCEEESVTTAAGNTSKISALLDILQKKVNGFPALIDALQVTGQDGALRVLGIVNSGTTSSVTSTVTVTMATNSSTKVVGSPECKFSDIIMAIEDDEAAALTLERNWTKIADVLEIPPAKKVTLEKKSSIQAFEEIIQEWQMRLSNEATLALLIELLKKRKLNSMVTALEPLL